MNGNGFIFSNLSSLPDAGRPCRTPSGEWGRSHFVVIVFVSVAHDVSLLLQSKTVTVKAIFCPLKISLGFKCLLVYVNKSEILL